MTGKRLEELLEKAKRVTMTPEQKIQMAYIGERVIKDDILLRAEGRSRTALRTMARAVQVTVNETK